MILCLSSHALLSSPLLSSPLLSPPLLFLCSPLLSSLLLSSSLLSSSHTPLTGDISSFLLLSSRLSFPLLSSPKAHNIIIHSYGEGSMKRKNQPPNFFFKRRLFECTFTFTR